MQLVNAPNPDGRPNSECVRPWVKRDRTSLTPAGDYGSSTSLPAAEMLKRAAALYEASVSSTLRKHEVLPLRETSDDV